jgi:hypothetical protein
VLLLVIDDATVPSPLRPPKSHDFGYIQAAAESVAIRIAALNPVAEFVSIRIAAQALPKPHHLF